MVLSDSNVQTRPPEDSLEESGAWSGSFPGPAREDVSSPKPQQHPPSVPALQRGITERLRLAVLREQEIAAKAREANSATLAFLGRVSHELRGPLNAIRGYVDLLDMEVHGPVTARQREDLHSIREAEKQLVFMVNDLLEFLKVQSGRLTYRAADVAVDDLLTGAFSLLKPALERGGLHYHGVACGPDITVRADPDRSRQIIVNLLTNAIKFTAPGGEITVECAACDETVQIRVSDTGAGIPSDRLQDIFIPFVQVAAGQPDSKAGVGLGLPISRDLARAMHGDLTVTSTVGVGSTFTLTLPRH